MTANPGKCVLLLPHGRLPQVFGWTVAQLCRPFPYIHLWQPLNCAQTSQEAPQNLNFGPIFGYLRFNFINQPMSATPLSPSSPLSSFVYLQIHVKTFIIDEHDAGILVCRGQRLAFQHCC